MGSRKKWNGQIAFEADGSLLECWDGYSTETTHWDWSRSTEDGRPLQVTTKIIFKDNYVFEDELIYDGYGSGRSKIIIWLRSVATGALYPMLMGDYDALMRAGMFNGARIRTRFTFVKRGANFRLVPADKVKKCKHCGHARKDHVNDKCLFDASVYEIDGEVQKIT